MYPDTQNSLNQFEEVSQPPIGHNSYSGNDQDEEDDLPLMEDLGIGKFTFTLIFFIFLFLEFVRFCLQIIFYLNYI